MAQKGDVPQPGPDPTSAKRTWKNFGDLRKLAEALSLKALQVDFGFPATVDGSMTAPGYDVLRPWLLLSRMFCLLHEGYFRLSLSKASSSSCENESAFD